MNIKETIFELIRTDYPLRKFIADKLDIREPTVLRWAYRKQHAKVANYMVVNLIKEHAGLSDEDIFETEIHQQQ